MGKTKLEPLYFIKFNKSPIFVLTFLNFAVIYYGVYLFSSNF